MQGDTPGSPEAQKVHIIPVHLIDPSPKNPRKTYSTESLQELGDSLKRRVLQPIMVRVNPSDSKRFELVFGERRWRAAQVVEMPGIPAFLEETLDDSEMREIQLIENIQREDAHPLDEAVAMEQLQKDYHYSVSQLCTKLGKKEKYIRRRLQLTKLWGPAREGFYEGKIPLSKAQDLATVPQADQEKAFGEILHRSAAEAGKWIDGQYRLKLSEASFNPDDEKLVSAAGACRTCEFRTGKQAELFEAASSPDLCTKPTCYHSKLDAHWEIVAKSAKERGQRVFSDAETKRYFTGEVLRWDSGFIDLDDDNYVLSKKYREILQAVPPIQIILGRDLHGHVHEAIEKEIADPIVEAAEKAHHDQQRKESGTKDTPNPLSKGSEQDDKEEADEKAKERARKAFLAKVDERMLDNLLQKATKDPDTKFWFVLGHTLIDTVPVDDLKIVAKRHKIKPENNLVQNKDYYAALHKHLEDQYKYLQKSIIGAGAEHERERRLRVFCVELLAANTSRVELYKHYEVSKQAVEKELTKEQKKAEKPESTEKHREKTTSKATAPKSSKKTATKSAKADGDRGGASAVPKPSKQLDVEEHIKHKQKSGGKK